MHPLTLVSVEIAYECSNGVMANWWNGRMAEWQNGILEEWQIVSSRELRRGESDEEMHSCLPTLAESDFVETKAGSKSRFTSYKKSKYSKKGSVLGV
jgi:hypothetical protein